MDHLRPSFFALLVSVWWLCRFITSWVHNKGFILSYATCPSRISFAFYPFCLIQYPRQRSTFFYCNIVGPVTEGGHGDLCMALPASAWKWHVSLPFTCSCSVPGKWKNIDLFMWVPPPRDINPFAEKGTTGSTVDCIVFSQNLYIQGQP